MKIKTKSEYTAAIKKLETWAQKNPDGNDPETNMKMQMISEAIEAYEDKSLPSSFREIPQPTTIPDALRYKMYELNLDQKDLAKKLGIAPTRISEILSKKRKINLSLAKKLHSKLGLDPRFILEKA
ncbi:MAG: helix-turn-helix domain-containing protein [Chloroherpetonaceae bacterium]|nr:helix-turn-helix domain-containing protein [Chloroherpetonaceae bacterium]